MSRRVVPGRWMVAAALLAFAGPAAAQVVYPAPPAEYDATVRYRIRAARNERITRYLEMTRALDAAGLRRENIDPSEAADPNAERLYGKLPASGVRSILSEPH